MKAQEACVNRMKELSQEQKLSMNALANTSGVPRSTVKSICYGVSNNTGIETIAKLCNGLNITVADFFSAKDFHNLEPEIE